MRMEPLRLTLTSVGAILAEKWEGFLGVEPPAFDPQTLSDMTQDIRDKPWKLP